MSKESELAAELEKEFFGPDFFAEEELVNRLLKCRSLEEFAKIKAETDPVIFQNLFVSANFSDPEAKRFTAAELENIFDSLPTLTSSENEFI